MPTALPLAVPLAWPRRLRYIVAGIMWQFWCVELLSPGLAERVFRLVWLVRVEVRLERDTVWHPGGSGPHTYI